MALRLPPSFPVSIQIGCLVTRCQQSRLSSAGHVAGEGRQTQKSAPEPGSVDRMSRDWGPGDRDLKYHCQIFGRPEPLELSGD